MGSVTVAYWDIRGLGQPCRLICEAGGIPYTDKKYTVETDADGKYSSTWWSEDKHSLDLDFPNLPYLIDGDLRITETSAIIQHLAERAGLMGSTAAVRAHVAMTWSWSHEVRGSYVKMCYGGDKSFDDLLPKKMEALNKYRTAHPTKWLCGEELTYMDLVMYDLLEQFQVYSDGCLSEYPALQKLITDVKALPKIADYIASDRFCDRPFNNVMACFK